MLGALGRGAETTGDRFYLPQTHGHARSRPAAANLIQETAKRTCGPAPVPGGGCCRCPRSAKTRPGTHRAPRTLTALQGAVDQQVACASEIPPVKGTTESLEKGLKGLQPQPADGETLGRGMPKGHIQS